MQPPLRQRQLLQTLTLGRTAAKRLAHQLGACLRTIYRDIQALRNRGYDIRSVGGRKGGFWLAVDSKPLPIELSTNELREVVLALTRSAYEGALVRSGSPHALIAKLLASLPHTNADRIRAVLANILLPDPVICNTDDHVLHAFEAAVYHRRCIHLVSNEPHPVARYLQPTSLAPSASGWDLVGTERSTGAVHRMPVQKVSYARVATRRTGPDPEPTFLEWIRAQPMSRIRYDP